MSAQENAPDENWRVRGLCVTSGNPDLWFPPKGGDSAERSNYVKTIQKICNACPVRLKCFEEGMEMHAQMRDDRGHLGVRGIWAGTTQNQRTTIHKRMAS